MTAVDHDFFTTLYVTNVLNGTLAARDPTVPGGVVPAAPWCGSSC